MMKLKILFLIGSCIWSLAHADFISKQEFMSSAAVKKHFGNQSFSGTKFKSGTVEERAAMSFSLVTQRHFVGKTVSDVKSELGEFTGFFFSDGVPAYLITEGWKKAKETWQLVFLLDDTGRVSEVRVHKNCCR